MRVAVAVADGRAQKGTEGVLCFVCCVSAFVGSVLVLDGRRGAGGVVVMSTLSTVI